MRRECIGSPAHIARESGTYLFERRCTRRVARVYFQLFSLAAPESPLTDWSGPTSSPGGNDRTAAHPPGVSGDARMFSHPVRGRPGSSNVSGLQGSGSAPRRRESNSTPQIVLLDRSILHPDQLTIGRNQSLRLPKEGRMAVGSRRMSPFTRQAASPVPRRPRDPRRSMNRAAVLRNFLDQAPEVQPWTLKFKDGWLEHRFQDVYFDTNLQYIRIATFLGAVTWAGVRSARPGWWSRRGALPRLRDPLRAGRAHRSRQPRPYLSAELSTHLAAVSPQRSSSAGSSGWSTVHWSRPGCRTGATRATC